MAVFELDEYSVSEANGNNTDLYLNDVIVDGSTGVYTPVNVGDVIKLVAWEGYTILVASIDYQIDFIDSTSKPFDVANPGIAQNEATLTWEAGFETPNNYVNIYVSSEQSSDTGGPEPATAYNKVYQVTQSELSQLSADRFVSIGDKTEDYGDYILGLIEIPTAVPEVYVGAKEDIQLGNVQLNTQATGISSDRIKLDMGSITTPREYDNFLDMEQTICTLHLPYAKSIAIDPYYVIDQTIIIEYLIDMYNGNATINLYSTKLEVPEEPLEPFATQETTMGVNIPYIALDRTPDVSNSNISLGGDNKITIPFIEVARPVNSNIDSFFNTSVTDEGDLSSTTGYIQVLNSDLSISTIYANELDDIDSILQSGIIIK